jgi:hypothetical protein
MSPMTSLIVVFIVHAMRSDASPKRLLLGWFVVAASQESSRGNYNIDRAES